MGDNREWGVGANPPACLHCGGTKVKARGRGLCVACYPAHKDEYPLLPRGRHAAKGAGNDRGDDQTQPENVGDDVPPVPVDAALGGGGLGEDADPLGEPSPAPTRERRPGGGLPSPPADAPGKPRSRWARVFGAKERPEGENVPRETSREVRPKVPRGRRNSGADTISDAWAGFGGLCLRNPGYVPLGRYMQFQAPVAGEMLDEAVAGTVVDKVIVQPITKARGKFDLMAAVFGPPALIVAIQRNPERADMLMPMLKSSIRNALPLMVPAIKKVAAKEAASVKAADDLLDDDEGYREYVTWCQGQGKKPDPADYILSTIFTGWAPATAEQSPEEAPVP